MTTPDLDADDLRAALVAARRRGATHAQVFVERRDACTIRRSGGADLVRADRDAGAAVRVMSGTGVLGLASTNVLTRAALVEAAEVAATVAGSSPSEAEIPPFRHLSPRPPQHPVRPAQEAGIPIRAGFVQRAADAARDADPRVRSVVVTYVDVVQHVDVADLDGVLRHDVRTRTRLTCRVVAREGDDEQAGFDGPGTGGGLELFDEHPPEEIGSRAAAQALGKLGAPVFSADDAVVVLGPAAGGLFLHEACGHGLEADGIARATSVYARTAGHAVAADGVTALDDPSLPGGFGSCGMDDEGRESAPTLLIADGVQVGALTDAATAHRWSRAATGNGRCESFAHRPLCRLSNTYIAAGRDRPDDVVGDVARGLFVARLGGGQVDIATGDFGFGSSEAYLIEGGRITSPVGGVTVVGNGPQALAAIDAVADDLAFTPALCGKDGQWVPVSYGSPTLRVPGLRVVAA